jgi:hypothetical protein
LALAETEVKTLVATPYLAQLRQRAVDTLEFKTTCTYGLRLGGVLAVVVVVKEVAVQTV